MSQKDILIQVYSTLTNYTPTGIDNFRTQVNALLDTIKEEAEARIRIMTLIEESGKF